MPTASNIVETAIKPTTVGSSAWIEKPTMSPAKNEQRTKAEILTEIVSDKLNRFAYDLRFNYNQNQKISFSKSHVF